MIDSLTYLVVRKQSGAHDSAVYSLAARENLLASGDDEGTVKLWDLRQRSLAHKFEEQEGFVAQLLFVPSAPHELIAIGSCGYVASLDIRTGTLIARSDPVQHEPTCGALIKNDGLCVVGTEDGTLELFHVGDWAEPLSSVNLSSGSDSGVQSVLTMSPYHNILFAGSDDGFVRVLSIEPTSAAEVLVEHVGASVERLCMTRDRQLLGSVGQDNMLKFSPIGHLFAENTVFMERRTAATRKEATNQFFSALDTDDNDNDDDDEDEDDDDDNDA